MATLLYVEASPRKERSASIEVAKAFLDAYRQSNPEDSVDVLDLWAADLPEVDGAILDAKYRILHGQQHTGEEAAAWQTIVNWTDRFKQADHYLFSLPMWNFGIPYKLKHFVDVIVQPGLTFTVMEDGQYQGLVEGKAVAIYARGGAYGEGTGAEAYDQQKPYLTNILGFMGITDVTSILVEPTLADAEQVGLTRRKAVEHAKEVALNWG